MYILQMLVNDLEILMNHPIQHHVSLSLSLSCINYVFSYIVVYHRSVHTRDNTTTRNITIILYHNH